MPNVIDDTNAAVAVPEIWGQKIIAARTNAFYMLDRVWRWDEEVKDYGDTIHAPRISQLTANDVGSDGSVSPQAITETEVQILLNKWKEITFRVTDKVMKQSKYNLPSEYSKQAGKGLAKIMETDTLGLWSGLSTNVLTTQSDFDEDFILSAVQKLDEALVPEDERFGILKPSQKKALLKIDKFVSSQYRNGAGEQITKGRLIMDLHGIEFSVSPLVITSGGEKKNLIWQREAFAVAVQMKAKMEKLARDGLRDTWTTAEVYGFGETRDDHAVVAPTTN